MSIGAVDRPFDTTATGIRIRVRLTPRGGRDVVEGVERLADGRSVLKAHVRAAPEKGEANAALEQLLARVLSAPKSSVSVVGGGTSRLKVVEVKGDPMRLLKAMESLPCD